MTALYLVGDVFAKIAELRRRRVRVALALCSPPFLALRSYLPAGHPLKTQEIGSEATPAAFIDMMLALVAEVAHVLEPWGSIAWELGDTYAGSGGAGGDYDPDGLRAGQPRFRQRTDGGRYVDGYSGGVHGRDVSGSNGAFDMRPVKGSAGWPLDKSLAGIPEAFMLSLAYGYNVLDRRGPDSPAGRWRVRNFKPWIRSNPPVGSLGDKERPATSYITVATRDAARYFDLDAVRTPTSPTTNRRTATGVDARPNTHKSGQDDRTGGNRSTLAISDNGPAGAPPRDWWHHVDAVLDACLDDMAGKVDNYERRTNGTKVDGRDGEPRFDTRPAPGATGARGVHLRRALERAGILRTVDALDVSPKGYKGAHYAVWPPELVKQLVLEMCPRRVCSTCGQPSRRIVDIDYIDTPDRELRTDDARRYGSIDGKRHNDHRSTAHTTTGWSDCGHGTWTPGRVLDPFVGSGTTLQVCSGLGRDSIGIDLDYTNVGLAMERVGMWLSVEWPEPDLEMLRTRALGPGSPHPASYDRWARFTGEVWHVWGSDTEPRARSVRMAGGAGPVPVAVPKVVKRRAVSAVAGQVDLFAATEEVQA